MANFSTKKPTIIGSFSGGYEFLSNFADCPIFYNGLQYRNTEAAFQAQKTLDPWERADIADTKTPGQAKRMGRRVAMRADWEQVKVREMLQILRLKFTKGSEFADRLDQTGDANLVEGTTWHDQFWGVCKCPEHGGEGVNMLGQILMHIRSENRQGMTLHFEPSLLSRKDWLTSEHRWLP